MDFQEVINENVEKKKVSQKAYLYPQMTDIFMFYEVLLCTCCNSLFCL